MTASHLESCEIGARAGRQGRGDARRAVPGPSAPSDRLPLVSVLIPVRNECDFLGSCLDSVLENTYPAERIEIVAIDGASDDGSRGILESYAARVPDLRVLENPKTSTPAALNLGIREARGDVILRLDAHARLAPDYIAQCVDWLQISGADNVGGAMRTLPRGGGLVAEAIAAALSHGFGVGGSAFRTQAQKPCWTDTVFGGCYRRDVFERVGGFNERLPRGQDLEFNLRLKCTGGRTLLVPSIRCDYFARSQWWPFLRHNWTNGVWAIRPFAESAIVPIRPRHLAPLGFVLSLIAAAAAWWLPLAVVRFAAMLAAQIPGAAVDGAAMFGATAFDAVFGATVPGAMAWDALASAATASAATASAATASGATAGPWPLLILLACYLTAAAVAAIDAARRNGDPRLVMVLPAVFAGLHLAYGLGSLWGVFAIAPALLGRGRRFRERFGQR